LPLVVSAGKRAAVDDDAVNDGELSAEPGQISGAL
jgi:hypothetical protein